MTRKTARWFVIGILGALVTITIIAAAGSRTDTLRRLVTDKLANRLDSEIDLSAFSVDLFPTVTVRGEGLVVRHEGRRDVPPLVSIDAFVVEGGLVGLLSRPRRFRTVTLTGLRINIPPGGIHGDSDGRQEDEARTETDPPPAESPFIIGRLRTDGAELRIIPRRKDKDPKLFTIERLEMESLGRAERMPFRAQLTNPVPRGLIQTEGTFGPWNRRDPGQTPVAGRYMFANADLSTIDGIGGILESTGEFGGELGRIAVKGETRTPDFRVNVSGLPVPLTTRFQALVDGTDGDTHLNDVYATIRNTKLHATGAVVGTKGVKGRTVTLDVRIDDGRIEDLLRLSVKSETPPMIGDVALRTRFTLPPGERDVVERLQLNGRFEVDGRFTGKTLQSKLSGMSDRARGEPEKGTTKVTSGLGGQFRLEDGVLTMRDLAFTIPGADVRLHGTYGLVTEKIDFDGTLRMDATISEAAGGGLKGFFLKAVDPFFRKGKAGAVLPIKVRGTRNEPEFGLDVAKALTPK